MKTFLLSAAGILAPAVAFANPMWGGEFGQGYGMMERGWGLGLFGWLDILALWMMPILVDALLVLAIWWLWRKLH